MEQIRTNTHGPFRSERSVAERSGAERSGKKRLRSQSLKEKTFFYIITCTNGAERNGEWNGMEWNETERNRILFSKSPTQPYKNNYNL